MIMKRVLYFILLFLTLIGIIGGIGYSIYNSAWVIAIGLVVTGYMAYPKVKETFNKLIS